MGRQKTISDDEVLRIAREVFRRQGHTATTRAIAHAAGISEAVLYQRFTSKDDLFFAAMRPTGPDIERLLGPVNPPDDARRYLQTLVVHLGEYFAEVIPQALHFMIHPSFDPATLARVQLRGAAELQTGLADRLASLARRKRITLTDKETTARLLLSLAHDWALGTILAHGTRTPRPAELRAMVDVVWKGMRR
jgi:AcrR family transcriptional regulator